MRCLAILIGLVCVLPLVAEYPEPTLGICLHKPTRSSPTEDAARFTAFQQDIEAAQRIKQGLLGKPLEIVSKQTVTTTPLSPVKVAEIEPETLRIEDANTCASGNCGAMAIRQPTVQVQSVPSYSYPVQMQRRGLFRGRGLFGRFRGSCSSGNCR